MTCFYCSRNEPVATISVNKDGVTCAMCGDIVAHKKYPLGLKPKWRHDETRFDEIIKAMMRYNESGKKIPSEWFEEAINLYDEKVVK